MDFPPTARPSRLGIEDVLTPISSPKRKRDCESHSEYDSPRASPMRFRTELPTRPRTEQTFSPTSPRSKVSRQLHALKLNKPDLAFSSPIAAFGQDQSSMDSSSGSWNTSSPPTESEAEGFMNNDHAMVASGLDHKSKITPPPHAPTLAPSFSIAPMPISPVPLPSPLPGRPEQYVSETGEPSALSTQMTNNSQMRSRRNSSPPPPQQSPSDLTWTASEITGHTPTDPTDDGYGINGIGFRPTPAMAYARTQRRKQQVAEWKTREAKEARQKRIDRRKKLSVDMALDGHGNDPADERRKVRFVDV